MSADLDPDVRRAIEREDDIGVAPTETVTVDYARRQFEGTMTARSTEPVAEEYTVEIEGEGGALPIA